MSRTFILSCNKAKTDIKEKMQKFGRFLSGMVMPNIGALIAWGLITVLFIPKGWIPNAQFAKLVDPMILYLIPILIAYTGGKMVYDTRGGVIGVIATIGAIAAYDRPMIFGAMIMGPLAAWILKKSNALVKKKIPTGFEMIIDNYLIGIIGVGLALLGYLVMGPSVKAANNVLKDIVQFCVNAKILPFASIIIEPAKILFLNNALNYGILMPIGIQEAQETGTSIFFLLEANPGPGLGVLLAYTFFGSKAAKTSAPGAIIFHLFGGIHEIYFPYILMKPILILAAVAGGISGIFTFSILKAGLVAPASPGSIVTILTMTPRGSFIGIILGVLISTIISFLTASFLLKISINSVKDEKILVQAKNAVSQLKGKKSMINVPITNKSIQKIVFACDAGMGSSALGASTLRNKFNKARIDIIIVNCPIDKIPEDADIVVTHEELTNRAKSHAPKAEHLSLINFIGSPLYDNLVERFLNTTAAETISYQDISRKKQDNNQILKRQNILLNQRSISKEDAVRMTGKLLVENNYVKKEYVNSMLEREKIATTYIGKGIAIPHGLGKTTNLINKSGIVILQFPDGILWQDDNKAYLVIGIAGKDNEHIDILTKIAILAEEKENLSDLYSMKDYEEFLRIFVQTNN